MVKRRKKIIQGKSKQERIAEELSKKILYIKAQCMLKGQKVPSTREITSVIAKRIKEEVLLYEEFIRL